MRLISVAAVDTCRATGPIRTPRHKTANNMGARDLAATLRPLRTRFVWRATLQPEMPESAWRRRRCLVRCRGRRARVIEGESRRATSIPCCCAWPFIHLMRRRHCCIARLSWAGNLRHRQQNSCATAGTTWKRARHPKVCRISCEIIKAIAPVVSGSEGEITHGQSADRIHP